MATTAGVVLTHPDRVVYPDRGITKQEVADYYVRVAPLMLPHIAGRLLSFLRCPGGSGAKCFFQKHLPPGVEASVRIVSIRRKNGERAEYAVATDAGGLVALVQYGVLEFHVWGCRAAQVERPDRVVFDLDPGNGVPWANVVEAAFLIRNRLRALSLESWVKTTGGSGLHVVVPIAPRATWDHVHDFARDFAEALATEYPGDFLSKAARAARRQRIFVDWLRNVRGATWVAPWSTRARPGAPISAPVAWQRLRAIKSASQFTLESVRKGVAADPWARINDSPQKLDTTDRDPAGEPEP
jgi:bifunctional non-homologous end joining protein LigD